MMKVMRMLSRCEAGLGTRAVVAGDGVISESLRKKEEEARQRI
jgi:hypothetical protein